MFLFLFPQSSIPTGMDIDSRSVLVLLGSVFVVIPLSCKAKQHRRDVICDYKAFLLPCLMFYISQNLPEVNN